MVDLGLSIGRIVVDVLMVWWCIGTIVAQIFPREVERMRREHEAWCLKRKA